MDNENETSSSGGFGKDYHGQDAFGERMTDGGIGGDGHESSFDAPDIDTTELSTTDSSFEGEANEVADSMKESIRGVNEETAENSNVGSMDTSFQIGGTEEEWKEKYQNEYERAEEELNRTKEWASKMRSGIAKTNSSINSSLADLDNKSITGRIASAVNHTADKVLDTLESLAKEFEYDDFDRNKIEEAYKEKGTEALRNASDELSKGIEAYIDRTIEGAQGRRDHFKRIADSYKSSTTDKTKTSFTDKMKPAEAKTDKPTEAKGPGENMANAKTSPSDYLTKANKDSTKEIAPNRNDFGNHAVDTLKGVTDRISGSVTADALGLKSIEEFARENGYDPEKLSTMKAYLSYQNKEIMKAIPDIVRKIGSYITERVKDAVDPSQLGERVRNTLARYNLATLIGAAILSIKSGAGLQASIDQALTMVDTEDQPAVSDYLEDVLNDEGTVNDLGNAFDDALAPEQSSASNELDESIVDIGRKDNTDYSGFNAGLGSSGTTSSDADAKVFIARNVKADPILRKMISKIGK